MMNNNTISKPASGDKAGEEGKMTPSVVEIAVRFYQFYATTARTGMVAAIEPSRMTKRLLGVN